MPPGSWISSSVFFHWLFFLYFSLGNSFLFVFVFEDLNFYFHNLVSVSQLPFNLVVCVSFLVLDKSYVSRLFVGYLVICHFAYTIVAIISVYFENRPKFT